jgi:hypothetical protein
LLETIVLALLLLLVVVPLWARVGLCPTVDIAPLQGLVWWLGAILDRFLGF